MCPQIKWLKRERKSEKREIWKGEINRHFHPGWEGAKGARQHRAPPPHLMIKGKSNGRVEKTDLNETPPPPHQRPCQFNSYTQVRPVPPLPPPKNYNASTPSKSGRTLRLLVFQMWGNAPAKSFVCKDMNIRGIPLRFLKALKTFSYILLLFFLHPSLTIVCFSFMLFSTFPVILPQFLLDLCLSPKCRGLCHSV